MPDDKRLESITEEIKLLKGEIKNSLTGVRDYLLNMELPSSEFSTILQALSGENGGQKISLDGNVGNGQEPKNEEPLEEPEITADDLNQPPSDEPLIDMEEPENLLEDMTEEEEMIEDSAEEAEEEAPGEEENEPSEDNMEELGELEVDEEEEETGETEEPGQIDDELDESPEVENEDSGLALDTAAEEEPPMELERTTADAGQGTPKVNMLANLINWVARAKREIGDDLLPTFLDVYGVSGHLSLELKEVILHLAERTKEKNEPCTDSEVWSQAMLSLHGILTGGDAPLNPAIPSWKEALLGEEAEDELIEVDKQEKPVKLKLVFPGGNGKGKNKEYCLNLTPEDDGSGE